MFHKNSRVQISWALYRRIIDCDLSATSLRALIGLLLYHDDRDHWHADHASARRGAAHASRLVLHRKIQVLPAGGADCRYLHQHKIKNPSAEGLSLVLVFQGISVATKL